MGKPRRDGTPDAFSFASVTDAELGAFYTSEEVQITGYNITVTGSVTGCAYSINGGLFTAVTPFQVNPGARIRLRKKSSSAENTPLSATLMVGGVSATWTITTADSGTVIPPDPFTFTDVTEAIRDTEYESNTVVLTGMDPVLGAPATVSGGSYSKNSGAWATTPFTAFNGDAVKVKRRSSALYSTALGVIFDVFGTSDTFTITTADEPEPPPPGGDYEASTRSELVTILGDDVTYPKTNKVLVLTADITGDAITLTGETWTNFTIRGISTSDRKRCPRLRFANCIFPEGTLAADRLKLKWLNFFNVATTYTLEGQITFTDSDSAGFYIYQCDIHDDGFATKNFRSGNQLQMFRGLTTQSGAQVSRLTIEDCNIYNQARSVLWGHTIVWNNNDCHDHYNHVLTAIASGVGGIDFTFNRCWNLWANPTDTNNPHSGVGLSPSPSGVDDGVDIRCIGNIMGPGDARSTWAQAQGLPSTAWYPGASGVKFNDMFATGFNYVRPVVKSNIIYGTDSIMLEIDAGDDFEVSWNTLVHDEAQNEGRKPALYIGHAVSGTAHHNIGASISFKRSTGGDRAAVSLYANASASPDQTGTDNLIAYSKVFAGPAFSNLADTDEMLAAFTLNATSPLRDLTKWPVTPGAVNSYYNFATGSGSWPATSPAVSTNATSQSNLAVTKSSAVWTRTPTAPSGTGAWMPSNLRVGHVVFRLSNDASIDASSRYVLTYQNSTCTLQRIAGTDAGQWRFTLRDATNAVIVSATSSIQTNSTDVLPTIVVAWDLNAARVLMGASVGSEWWSDFPVITTLRQADAGFRTSRYITVGDGSTTPPTSSAWVGQFETLVQDDVFTDIETDVGFSEIINTSEELADQTTRGATSGIYLHAAAASWNSSSFNGGNGTGGTGGLTATKFAKGGTAFT